jgi:hypothetical protein
MVSEENGGDYNNRLSMLVKRLSQVLKIVCGLEKIEFKG